MDHEAFVPFPVDTVRRALAEPHRVARCVPGLQRDADPDTAGDALAGRLRLRIGGSTITYRGGARISERPDGGFEVTAEGSEVRGGSTVTATLRIALHPADGGTRLSFDGGARAGGRLAEAGAEAAEAAGRRLLDRFAADLAAGLESESPEPRLPAAPPQEPPADLVDELSEAAEAITDEEDALLADGAEDELDLDIEVPETVAGLPDDPQADRDPVPAEAAHARRTMIGRSAEEVDHAPPRGRYAPVPAPETGSAAATLRWAAPAAAALLASAVVVGRVLRRRR